MFEIAGICALLIALAAIVVLGLMTGLRVRRLAAQAARLRSHPILDAQWLERKVAIVRSIGDGAQHMRDAFSRLSAALGSITGGLDELTVAAFACAGGVEELMDATAPWLRGLFAARGDAL